MKTLSLCMITKDAEKYIEQCINSVFSVVSEIIVVDTGSTDNTLDCIKKFNPKIYHYNWNNNFAEARNYSIQQATSEYILILDADEVLYEDDLPKLTSLLNNTNADGISIQFNNLTDEQSEDNFNTHIGLRIFKNGIFHYEGAIHEQVVLEDPSYKPVLEISDIRVKHYGYLKSNAGIKKHNRNLPILESLLAENPNDSFHLFNIGNEYMCLGECEKALKYFDMSDKYKNINMAYTPHLIYRRASCLHSLKRNEESLEVIDDGLKIYPNSTDMEFLRGRILTKMKRFTLALDSFNKCLDMGEAPPTLRFFTETSDFRPLMEMAEIYYLMDDYSKALDCYLKALKVNGKKYYVIYEVGKVLNKIFKDKNLVTQNLCALFADYSFKTNIMVIVDVLLNEKLFEQADIAYAYYINKNEARDSDEYFIDGRLLFYKNDYKAAFSMFKMCVDLKTPIGILPRIKERAVEYMIACCLIDTENKEQLIEIISTFSNLEENSVYMAFLNKHCGSLEKQSINIIKPILSNLLAVKEYDVFENTLNILNLVNDEEILLELADVYYKNNYHDMAVKTILRSIKELDSINSNAVLILNKLFIM